MNNNMYRQFQREIKKANRKAEVRNARWKIAFITLMLISIVIIFGQAAYYENNGIFSVNAYAEPENEIEITTRDSKILATVVEMDVESDLVTIARTHIIDGNATIDGDEWSFYGIEDLEIGDVLMVTFNGNNIYTNEIKDVWYCGYTE